VSEQDRTPMENAALALYYHAAQLIKAGKSRDEIITELTSKGINRDTAENMLNKLDKSRANVARQHGLRNMALGGAVSVLAALPLLGILVPAVTGTAFGVAVLLLGIGLFILGRGILQIIGI
jgi:hypothetical protein